MLIAEQGCAAFTMRAVARASGLKLGALQYHFPTRGALLKALATFVTKAYGDDFKRFCASRDTKVPDLLSVLDYMLIETLTSSLQTQRLIPQLWALAMVEPDLQRALNDLYENYLVFIESSLRDLGVREPRGDALAILAMLEGLTLFVDPGRHWERDAKTTLDAVRALVMARHGGPLEGGGLPDRPH
jgi:AcrR family transcriptional regulator